MLLMLDMLIKKNEIKTLHNSFMSVFLNLRRNKKLSRNKRKNYKYNYAGLCWIELRDFYIELSGYYTINNKIV